MALCRAQCATVYPSVPQCAPVCPSVPLAVPQCATVCHSQCAPLPHFITELRDVERELIYRRFIFTSTLLRTHSPRFRDEWSTLCNYCRREQWKSLFIESFVEIPEKQPAPQNEGVDQWERKKATWKKFKKEAESWNCQKLLFSATSVQSAPTPPSKLGRLGVATAGDQ